MLTGKDLGAAIESARVKKKITKKALAEHFGVQPPSIQDWVNKGTIEKSKLERLWHFFSDVVGPDHWGLSSFPNHQPGAAGQRGLASDPPVTQVIPLRPPIKDALPVVLDAMVACEEPGKLRTALIALLEDDSPSYRERVAMLLHAAPQAKAAASA